MTFNPGDVVMTIIGKEIKDWSDSSDIAIKRNINKGFTDRYVIINESINDRKQQSLKQEKPNV